MESELSLQKLDVTLLMWDMRRNLDPSPMPPRHSVIEFCYPELPSAQRSWWLLVDPNEGVDLCSIDPGFDVDLYVAADLRTMTAIWMGYDTVRRGRRPAHAPHRRSLARRKHANLASSLPLRPRTQTRELTNPHGPLPETAPDPRAKATLSAQRHKRRSLMPLSPAAVANRVGQSKEQP